MKYLRPNYKGLKRAQKETVFGLDDLSTLFQL